MEIGIYLPNLLPGVGAHEAAEWARRAESLGLDAIKSGYVTDLTSEGHSHWGQFMVRHYRLVIEKAARHRIALDVHEPVHDTGERRTYPNMMSREGARGQQQRSARAR